MNEFGSQLRPLLMGGALVVAALGGFFLARFTGTDTPPATQAETEAAERDELQLDASYLATVGIRTEPAAGGSLSANVLAPAEIAAMPTGIAVVTAHASGTVVRLTKQLGDAVRVGEMLAQVESREGAAMAAELSVAQSKATLARSDAAREKMLFDQGVTPRQNLELEEAELAVAEAEVRRARDAAAAAHVTPDGKIAVVSPIEGKITAVSAALGTFVQAERELFRIADPNLIQAEASVTALDAQRIAPGDPATIATASGAKIAASVRSVTPSVDVLTRTATVLLSLTGTHDPLSPGEIVQADIAPKTAAPSGVVIPEDAVQVVNGRNVVFVRTQTGFKVQQVVAGARSAGRIAILSGLEAGTVIATANAFFLKAELAKGAGDE